MKDENEHSFPTREPVVFVIFVLFLVTGTSFGLPAGVDLRGRRLSALSPLA
jgi:p-aminobenzoyl-glutamate transporter AbgT